MSTLSQRYYLNSKRTPFFARSNMAFLLLSLSALARLDDRVYYAVAKIDGGTKDRGSKNLAICELEGVRQLTGDGFRSTVGDGSDGEAGGDGEVREERVLTGYECLLSDGAEAQLTDQSLGRGSSRLQCSKRSTFRTMWAEGHED